LIAVGGAGAAGVVLVRARYLRWGATDDELEVAPPGDELVPVADLASTRAVTVSAAADGVWPWIAQLGPCPERVSLVMFPVAGRLPSTASAAPP
jgi:hypothetical protein